MWRILHKDTCVTQHLISSLGLLGNEGPQTHCTVGLSWPSSLAIMSGMRCVRAASTCAELQVCYTTACAKWTCLSTWADYKGLNSHWIQMCVTARTKWQVNVIRVSGGQDNCIKWRLFQQKTVVQLLFKVTHKVSLKFSDEKAHNTAYRVAIFHQPSKALIWKPCCLVIIEDKIWSEGQTFSTLDVIDRKFYLTFKPY